MKGTESGDEQENIYRDDKETKLTIIMEPSSIDFKITELPHLWTLTFRIRTDAWFGYFHALPRTWPSKEDTSCVSSPWKALD